MPDKANRLHLCHVIVIAEFDFSAHRFAVLNNTAITAAENGYLRLRRQPPSRQHDQRDQRKAKSSLAHPLSSSSSLIPLTTLIWRYSSAHAAPSSFGSISRR